MRIDFAELPAGVTIYRAPWNADFVVKAERSAGLSRVANNTRFLILPWVRVPHLAGHVLSQVVGRINGDWQAQYGQGLEWLETFVDPQRFKGTCYRAANWRYVGQTTGRSRVAEPFLTMGEGWLKMTPCVHQGQVEWPRFPSRGQLLDSRGSGVVGFVKAFTSGAFCLFC